VALTGNYLLVGAPQAGTSGTAYLYERSPNAWALRATLTLPNGNSNSKFGSAVAADDPYFVVAAPGDDSGTMSNAGTLNVYLRTGNTLARVNQFAGTAGQGLGQRLVMAQGIIAASTADYKVETYSVRNTGIEALATLRSPVNDPTQQATYGAELALDGKLLAVSRPAGDTVYVYRRSGSVWDLEAGLNEPNLGGVNAWVNGVLVTGQNNALTSYAYESGFWLRQASTPAPGGAVPDAVASEGTTLVSSDTTSGVVDSWALTGQTPRHTSARDEAAGFGTSLAMANYRIAVGNPALGEVQVYAN
jgi:hypothetical protein